MISPKALGLIGNAEWDGDFVTRMREVARALGDDLNPVKNSAMVQAPIIDTAGESPGPLIARLPRQAQNPHASIVVVHHTALRRLAD